MAGATLSVTIHDRGAREGLARLGRAMDDTTPLMAAIGTGLVEGTHTRFERAQSPDGAGWAPLSPGYAPVKRGPGILRESAMRGGLMGSINSQPGRDEVRVGTNKIYAAIHQFGGTITPKAAPFLVFRMAGGMAHARSVTLPARPFLGISAEDEEMIGDVVEVFLRRVVG